MVGMPGWSSAQEHSVQEIIAAIQAPLSAEEVNTARRADEQFLSTGNFAGTRGRLVTDPRITTLPNTLTRNLLNAMGENPNDWIVRVVETNPPVVNAFVVAGKYIYVFKELLAKSTSEDEVAFIMAHELGHSFLHHLKRRTEALTQRLSNLADLVDGLLKKKDGASKVTPYTTAIRADYSRTDESEADTFGAILAKKAGYNPQRGIDFFSRQIKAHTEELRVQLNALQREEAVVDAGQSQCDQYVQAYNASRNNRKLYSDTLKVCKAAENRRVAYNTHVEQYNNAVAYDPWAMLKADHPPNDERIALIASLVDYLDGKGDLNSLNRKFPQPYKVILALQQLDSPLLQGARGTQTAISSSAATEYFRSGLRYFKAGNYQEAVNEYSKALQLDSRDVATYYNRGIAYDNLKLYQQSISDFDKAINLISDNSRLASFDSQTYAYRGIVYNKLANYQMAISDFNKAADLDPRSPHVYYNRGFAYHKLSKYQEAINDFDKAIDLDPKNTLAYTYRGIAYNALANHQMAINDFDKAIDLAPKNTLAYLSRAAAYNALANYQMEINDFDKAADLVPKSSYVYYNRGLAYHKLAKNKEAIDDFDKAIDLDPKNALAYISRGIAYNALANHQMAINDFNKAADLDPRSPYAYYNRAFAYLKLAKYQEAINDFDKAIDLDPKNALAYSNRAFAYSKTGRRAQAIEDYKTAAGLGHKGAQDFLRKEGINW
jgi:tetratricopeptide (TPR) repeat protein